MQTLLLYAARLRLALSLSPRRIRFGAALLLLVLICGLLLLYPGPARLRLLGSGSRAVYQNLRVLWNRDPLKVHVIDVGQGDATLIQYSNRTVLIDAGPPEAAASVLAYLRQVGVERVDLLILTHPHDDHLGGAPALLEEFPVGQILVAHESAGSRLQMEIIASAGRKGIPVSHPVRGMRVMVKDLALDCLHPLPEVYANINNYSSVWRMTYGEVSFLFLADIELDAIASLSLTSAEFVRSGHHGSLTSTSEELLLTLRPRLVAISSGFGNSFGHPSREVLAMLERFRIPYVRTDHTGTAVFSTDGRTLAGPG